MSSACGRYFKICQQGLRHSKLFLNLNNDAKRFFHASYILNVQGMPIKMPSLSPTMMEGTIVKWLKQEGDHIQPGDILCDIETDKAVVSFEIEEEGILAKILVKEDTKYIKIGTLIALLVEEGEDWKFVEMPPQEEGTQSEPQTEQQNVTPKQSVQTRHSFGPSVHILLEKYGLMPEEVSPGGPHGRLLKGDVLKLIQQKNLQPKQIKIEPFVPPTEPQSFKAPEVVQKGEDYADIQLTSMRKTIAKRLSQSKSTIAHNYATLECKIDNLLTLRKRFKKDGISVSVNDFIIKAVAVALTRCPEVNCVWNGSNLITQDSVDISVAVATDAGLITPIIRGADSLGLQGISAQIKDLAGRARENKLKLNEFQGGTFTISNLGMFGISEFTAIINPPQCAILAVGGGQLTLGVDGLPETRMRATISYDQKAISEDTAVYFMQTLKEILEHPSSILLGSQPKKFDHALAGLL